jgi:uncharacterized sporulation protein YeaH/YhbH (DUF444 family)
MKTKDEILRSKGYWLAMLQTELFQIIYLYKYIETNNSRFHSTMAISHTNYLLVNLNKDDFKAA